MMRNVAKQDPEVYESIVQEFGRQQDDLELIASENYVSEAVMEAMGTPLTNKYAEGLPGRRYYGGCEFVDGVERLARSRVKSLFGVEAANVQPHSGAQANAAVFLAACKGGDTVMGQDLSHGGHLSHGSPVNSSGMLYNPVHYPVDIQTGRIDMNQVRDLAKKHRPRLIVCGASAYARVIDFAAFGEIAKEVDAVLLADIAHIAGLVVTGHHPTPVGHCDFITSTTHKTLRGPRGGLIMAKRSWGNAMNKAVFPGTQGGPLMHVIAAKAVAFKEASQPEFSDYIGEVISNAKVMANRLMERGVKLVSDGTDNHLILLHLQGDTTGKMAEDALGAAGITVNKNTVPGEQRSPLVTSGVRVGTAAMTTRGMGNAESVWVADKIADIIARPTDSDLIAATRLEVQALCGKFPVYRDDLVSI
jgi:glycine hydroxymethyltransferase